jgi:DNA topoisomerase I
MDLWRGAGNDPSMFNQPESAAESRGPSPSSQGAHTARRAGLVYVSDTMPGIARLRVGRTFRYLTPRRHVIRDRSTLRRISALAVPPAYRDVWICNTPRGHLQATGRDARGRKQYRYHQAWREIRDGAKFDRMADFVAALPALRRRLKRDLALKELCRDKVLACAVTILSTSAARVGNAEYARDNHSFGITTLRSRHVSFARGGRATLDFVGKGRVRHEIVVDRKRIVDIVRRCHALPGHPLFQYLDPDGKCRPIDSGMVNAYLSEAMGGDFTAKDFRTWHATVHAIDLLRSLPVPSRQPAVRRACVNVLKGVARLLRNTPAVCRKSYVSPQVFTAWENGILHERLGHLARLNGSRAERALISFLRKT